jgi:hypothetical protein
MSDYVWVSAIFKNARLNRGWNTDIFHSGKSEQEPWLFSANRYGLPVPEEHRMQKIWADEDDAPIKKLPPVFETDYAILVSEKVKPVFDGFDLGKGDLLPMKDGIFQSDQVTKYGEEYFSWVIGNSKSCFLADESANNRKLHPADTVYEMNMAEALSDDDVAVSLAALDGADQWVDPLLQSSLFLSRRLGDAIVEAGLKEAFFLYRCRVLEGIAVNGMEQAA